MNTPLTYTTAQLKEFRGRAHGLKPVVMVGQAGVTDEVIAATELALADHGLIKVRLRQPEDKAADGALLAERTQSALCGIVGHTVTLFRPIPEKPVKKKKVVAKPKKRK